MILYCSECESPDAERVNLGYIANDGTWGHVAGIACRACGHLAADPGAADVAEGRVDLRGMTAPDWTLTGLRAAGRKPRPRS